MLGSGGLEEVCTQLRFCRQEGMLRDLQKSVEEEEQVWKAKLTVSEEELQKVSVRGLLLGCKRLVLAINWMATYTVPANREL